MTPPEAARPDQLLAHPYDRYQRLRAVAELLEGYRSAAGRTRLRVLDVGGLDGHLALFVPASRLFVVDPGHEPGAHVRGRAQELPLLTGSVDAVASIDTYEHVAEGERAAFIAELCRVSAGPVILAAPFATAGVADAERFVSDCHRQLTGQEHRWLVEHAAAGLPDLEAARTEMGRHRARVHAAPNTALDAWRVMMALNAILDAIPESSPIQDAVNVCANGGDLGGGEPAYRHVLVGCDSRDGWVADALRRGTPGAGAGGETIARVLGIFGKGIAETLGARIATIREMDALVRRAEAMADAMKRERAAFASEIGRAREHVERVESAGAELRADLQAKNKQLAEAEGYARHVETEFQRAVAAMGEQERMRQELSARADALAARVAELEQALAGRSAELEKLSSHFVVRTLKRVTKSEL